MIRHVVMWRIDDREAALDVADRLRGLEGAVPGVLRVRVDLDAGRSEGNASLLLTMDLQSWDALAAYHSHPLHERVATVVRAAATLRSTVDFEVVED